MRIQKAADVFWARRVATKTLQILKENVVRERQMRDATQWYRMRSGRRALLSWQNATHRICSRDVQEFLDCVEGSNDDEQMENENETETYRS